MRRTLTDIFHYDLGSVSPLNPLVQLVVKHDLRQKLPNKLKCVDEILQSQSAPPTVPVCGELIDLLLHLEKNVSVALYTMLFNIYTFVIVARFFSLSALGCNCLWHFLMWFKACRLSASSVKDRHLVQGLLRLQPPTVQVRGCMDVCRICAAYRVNM